MNHTAVTHAIESTNPASAAMQMHAGTLQYLVLSVQPHGVQPRIAIFGEECEATHAIFVAGCAATPAVFEAEHS
eukprot:scaffold303130_cov30-Tisochrysis_lutea.AAC.1